MIFIKQNWKRLLAWSAILLVIPTMIALGVVLFEGKKYNLISVIIAIVACVPFFAAYEKGQSKLREMVIIAVMVALSVAGRCIFAFVPGFKPVTAVVIIAGIYLGKEAGFMTGALSAIISNLIFGQGPWTPFQMFIWGIIGFVCGVFGRRLNKWWWLVIVGAIAGALFSMVMDAWTVLSFNDGFNLKRYFVSVAASLPWMAIYMVSNIVFLLALTKPIGNRLDRLKQKYGIFENERQRQKRLQQEAKEMAKSQTPLIFENEIKNAEQVESEKVRQENDKNAIDKICTIAKEDGMVDGNVKQSRIVQSGLDEQIFGLKEEVQSDLDEQDFKLKEVVQSDLESDNLIHGGNLRKISKKQEKKIAHDLEQKKAREFFEMLKRK